MPTIQPRTALPNGEPAFWLKAIIDVFAFARVVSVADAIELMTDCVTDSWCPINSVIWD